MKWWTTPSAVIGIATTTLRAVIGEMPLDDVLSQRERINEELRLKLDEITERWGIKVTQVEIREIEPPRDIQDAMNRQMSAERVRRAAVTEAEGIREAAITVAEGEKQAAILNAEGERQAEILSAEGDQQAAVLRAEGFSTALDKVYGVAQNIDSNTLSLQYFDTLQKLGESSSTKVHIPDGVHEPAASVYGRNAAQLRRQRRRGLTHFPVIGEERF